MLRVAPRRFLSSTIRSLNSGVVSPKEFVAQKNQEKIEQQKFETTLKQGEFPYTPKVLSQLKSAEGKPLPINEELLKYKPIRLPKTHGHEVVNMKFRGYNEDDIGLATEFASRAAYYLGIPVSGIIKEKTEKRLYTVIRSPFAQAKSKENFWRTTFNYKLIGYDANPEVIDLWLSYINKYALDTVSYKARITARESLTFVEELDSVSIDDVKIPENFNDAENPIMQKVQELLNSEELNNITNSLVHNHIHP